jgi:hypothetical protein
MQNSTRPPIQEGELRFYKGIYPVRVTLAGGRKHRVQALVRFLLTSHYSSQTRWIIVGEEMTVPARLLWPHQRRHRGNGGKS